MKKDILTRLAVLLGISSLIGLGAWQASLQARSGNTASPLIVSGSPAVGPVLDCGEVRSRVGQFLDMHYSFRAFDENLSERTFQRVFESLDPSRSYLLESDMQRFAGLRDKLPQKLSEGDCGFVGEMRQVFLKRFKERNQKILQMLDEPFDFEKDEQLYVGDPKWATTLSELDERWRKRIKFQLMNMMISDPEERARQRLVKRYQLARENELALSKDEELSIFLNAFASALDPHSSHFLPADQEDFNIRLGNRLEGIGATLRDEDGYITVQVVMPGGAADRDGRLRSGDVIVGVDSGSGEGMTDVVDMPLSKAVRLIRGPKGTKVKLLLLRKSESGQEKLTLEIVRDSIELTASRAKGSLLEIDGKKLGVVKLPSFYTDFNCRNKRSIECSGATSDVWEEIQELQSQGAAGIVLDLRNNGGGDLQESILLTGLFIPEGPVVQTVDRRRITRSQNDTDGKTNYTGPLLVYVNKYSASASEIVAGALQDYGRALVVGDEHSYGKATVQVVQEIAGSDGRRSDGAIKVTQSKFYRPSGRSNQQFGVESDIVIPSLLMASEVGERKNQFALPADKIRPAAGFRKLSSLGQIIPNLREMSQSRLSQDPQFVKLRERIQKFEEQRRRASVSLLTRTQESEEAEEKAQRKEEQKKAEEELLNRAFSEDDFAIREAGRILLDAIELKKGSPTWVTDAAR